MLLNLKTIYKPDTLEDAITLLDEPGTYPLYGGGALLRNPRPEVRAGVDLSLVGLNYVRDSENNLRIGTMCSLEEVRTACLERADRGPRIGAIAETLALDFPETLRHTLTLGDLLMERNSQSLTLTLFLALGGVLKRLDMDMHYTAAAWLGARGDVARALITHIRVLHGSPEAVIAVEKVARTPADAPIVGAVACLDQREDGRARLTLALCGAAPTPIPQPVAARRWEESGDIDAALDALSLDPPGDHWGSAEYRSEMARVVVRRALEKVTAG